MTLGKHPATDPFRHLMEHYEPRTRAEADCVVEGSIGYAKVVAAAASTYASELIEYTEGPKLEGLEELYWALMLIDDLLALAEAANFNKPFEDSTAEEAPAT
jgi:hypothetical protein